VEVPDRQLISAVRTALAAAGDSEKAPQMQAYMKSAMPFYGVQAPRLREICREVFAERPLADRNTWLSTVRALWRDATHREERYVAIALTGDRRYRPFQTADLVPDLYQELVVTGAWWDYVDEVAIRRIGPILRFQPAEVTPMMRAWAVARKAIGWALREHAKIDPEWVREFVTRRDGALSGLSKREALKNIAT
jgi:3-methyladenine DNA glycosylase AlkD